MATTANFTPGAGLLSVFGDSLNNTITVSRDAAGTHPRQRRRRPDHGRHADGRQHHA